MEHWLPLLEDRLVTLFDHLGKHDLMVVEAGAQGAIEERLSDVADYFHSRSDPEVQKNRAPIARWSRPRSIWARRNWRRRWPDGPRIRPSPSPARQRQHGEFRFRRARDFAPSARGDNPTKPPPST
jgi:transcription-repair coupling factor (superfamily II helicase)